MPKNKSILVMTKKITFSKVFFLFLFSVCSVVYGQKQKNTNKEEGTIVFGKVYTIDELKETKGVIRCSSSEYEAYLQKQYPDRMNEGQFEAWINPLIRNAAAKSQNGDVITIPVVVHVIHSGENYGVAPNIPDAQVASQITVMSQDFRKMFGTRGFNNETVGADIKIQFALAKVDPNGNPTNGIDRVNMCRNSWSMDEVDAIVKPQTIWDPTQYMNMWSVNFSNQGLLGYAQFPSGSNLSGLNANGGLAETDGVVAGYWCFGSNDHNDGTFSLQQGVDLGRTMTHEVGHFLGLRHLWGDGNCLTDYCDDTPFSSSANNAHYICNPSQDSCPTMPGLDMVRNYMNYTYDLCMNIFTNDQKARITAVMNNSPRRASLKTSTKDIAIPLFANDAELKAEKICSSATTCGGTASIPFLFSLYNRGTSALTSAVITYTVNGGAAQTYNWTGNLTQDRYAIISITAPENSTISAQITSVNGTSDARSTNNYAYVASGSFTTTPSASSATVTFTLQPDFYGTETTWTLKNSAGVTVKSGGPYLDGILNSQNQIVALPALVTETWNLAPDCYVFTINDTEGDGIYYYGYYNIKDAAGNTFISEGAVDFGFTQSQSFKVLFLDTKETNVAGANEIQLYPNPATDVLNITKVSDKAAYQIHNAAGQLVKSGTIKNNKVNVSELIKGTYIITVKESNVNKSIKFIKK